MTDDDRLHGIDAIGADDLGICHDPNPAGGCPRSVPEPYAEPPRNTHVAGTQYNENTLTTLQGAENGNARGVAVSGDDKIHGPHHSVRVAETGSTTPTKPLSVRRNASSCRSSRGLSRRGRNSLWPIAGAGARL